MYMLHWLNKKNYTIAGKYDQSGFLQQLKEKGLARKTGFSYRDTAGIYRTAFEEKNTKVKAQVLPCAFTFVYIFAIISFT